MAHMTERLKFAIFFIIYTQLFSIFDYAKANVLTSFVEDESVTNSQLRMMLYDHLSSIIYLSSKNHLYSLASDDLSETKPDIETGPKLDHPNCSVNPEDTCSLKRTNMDSYAQSMNLDSTSRNIVVCFTLYGGSCSKVSIDEFAFTDHIYLPVVPNHRKKLPVVLFGSSENTEVFLFVAASQGPSYRTASAQRASNKNGGTSVPTNSVPISVPMLAARKLADFEESNSIQVLPQYIDWFPIDFITGFSHQGVAYYFSNHPSTLVKPANPSEIVSTATYVMRICEQSRMLIKGFAELKMSCVADGVDYPFLRDAVIKPYILSPDNIEIFGVFNKERDQKEGSSAVCAFSWMDIDKAFQTSISECFRGVTVTGPGYLPNSGNKCQPMTTNVGSSFCGNFDKNYPIFGNEIVQPSYAATLKQGVATAIDTQFIDGHIVAFVGFSNGKLGKFKADSANSVINFGDIEIANSLSSILDIQIGSSDDLYVLTDQKLFRVKTYNCMSVETCSECVADPHCGWCLLSNSCTQSAGCSEAGAWLSNVCLNYNLSPTQVASNELKINEFAVTLNHVPQQTSEKSKQCILESSQFPAQIVSARFELLSNRNFKIVCSQFNDIPNLSVSFVNASLKISINAIKWTNSSLLIYNCGQMFSCTECISLPFGCQWCASSHKCLPSKNDPSSCPSGLLRQTNLCPRIELDPGAKFIKNSGEESEYNVVGRNLYKSFISTLKCGFKIDGTTMYTTGVLSNPLGSDGMENTQVKCSPPVKLAYKSQNATQIIPMNLVWMDGQRERTLDNLNNASVQLYKCNILAKTCGQCLTLSVDYSCVWCDTSCVFTGDCKSSLVLNKNQICSNPTITSIEPVGGPQAGGTVITVKGTNLGKTMTDLSVTIDKKACLPTGKYVPSESFQCITSSNGFSLQAPVVVKISNLHTVSSLQKFDYKNPKINTLSPKEGLRSSKTRLVLQGFNLDYGSQYNVSINKLNANIISRNSTHLIIEAPTQPSTIQAPVSVKIDKMAAQTLTEKFTYLENPDVFSFDPKISFLSGGTNVELKGRNFLNIKDYIKPKLIAYVANTNKTAPCQVRDDQLMICKTPDLRSVHFDSSTSYALDFGLVVGTVDHLLNLQSAADETPLRQLVYYNDPVVAPFASPLEYRQGAIVEVNASNVYLLKKFEHTHFEVSGKEVEVYNSNEANDQSKLLFQLPYLVPLPEEDNKGKAELVVGNFRKFLGYLQYPNVRKVNAAAIVCLVLGLLLLVVIAVVVMYCISRRRKKKMQRDRQVLPTLSELKGRSSSNPYAESNPNAAEARPLREEDRLDIKDEHYFENLMKRIEINDEVSFSGKEDIYITRERLELGRLIGRGHFGSVFAATLRDKNMKNPFPVAVKTIDDPDLNQTAVENFLREGLIMKKFDHPHVLSLFGLCLGYKKEPMVILPFMSNGDLRTYIKDSKKTFTARQLLSLVQQVAQGMTYLSNLNFIHRDLASRNCMIDDKSMVKVADFGLSHQLHDREYYSTKDHKAKLPIKWMALESLENFTFTTKSDVWSFGVLMWEVMMRGVTPYPDVQVFEIRDYLSTGRRLRKPKYCPDNVYDIMMSCWRDLPEQRPPFGDLVNQLEVLLNPPKMVSESSQDGPNYMNTEEQEASAQEYLRPKTSATSTV